MKRTLIIGAGGVGRVVAFKCAQDKQIFGTIMLASRTEKKCQEIAASVKERLNVTIQTATVDADDVPSLVALLHRFKPDVLIHVALPYQDLTIMEACLQTKTHYLDTANYEPLDEAKFEYKWQWDYHQRFADAGITAILGCGFDPGMTSIYTAHALKNHFDEIHYLDIVDCNAGDHGHPFATNFNPEINIREITQNGKYYKDGQWIETVPQEIMKVLHYPNIGPRESYLIYHEELESLVKHIPTIKQARFWMTFGKKYLNYLQVIQDIGMASIIPVQFEGKEIVPLQFLKAVLPDPGSLGDNYKGETSIGCRIKGIKSEKEKTYYIYNNCKHQTAFQETGAQGVSYTTGVPAALGARLLLEGLWKKPGVWNVEQFDPDPFMDVIGEQGLPWHEVVNQDLEMD